MAYLLSGPLGCRWPLHAPTRQCSLEPDMDSPAPDHPLLEEASNTTVRVNIGTLYTVYTFSYSLHLNIRPDSMTSIDVCYSNIEHWQSGKCLPCCGQDCQLQCYIHNLVACINEVQKKNKSTLIEPGWCYITTRKKKIWLKFQVYKTLIPTVNSSIALSLSSC